MQSNVVKKIFIIHFHPLEQYPPIMNLVNYLGVSGDTEVVVVTNRAIKRRNLNVFGNKSANIKIYRPAGDSDSPVTRYLNYILFYFSSLFLLLWHKPAVVFYFETLSSWPALIYKKLRGKKVSLMAHYHEYTSTLEYNTRMLLSKWMHAIELNMYPVFSWISQTNPVRMQKFIEDNHLGKLPATVFHIMPNYPPAAWGRDSTAKNMQPGWPKKLVYVGSLGYKNMYLKEVVEWMAHHKQDFTLDIYAYNINDEAKAFLKDYPLPNIQFCGGCDYDALPGLLKQYDIGLVIYKPFSENTIHAVSNKVFEYLACGLDVWFSSDMTFTLQYVKEDSYPKIIPVDFNQLATFDYKKAIDRKGLPFIAGEYFCENVYNEVTAHVRSGKNGTV